MSTLALEDLLQRADSSPGSPGNSWTDTNGADWSISSHQLVSISGSLTNWPGATCLRPAGEVTQNSGKDQAVVAYVLGSNAAIGNPNTSIGLILRLVGTTCYALDISFANGVATWRKVVSGTQTSLGSAGAFEVRSGTNQYIFLFGCQQTDATHTTLTVKVWRANSLSLLLSATLVDTETTLQNVAGQLGLRHDYACTCFRFQEWNYDGGDPTLNAYGVFMPTPVVSSVGQNSTNLTVQVASGAGSTPPYTYQWYRASAPDFTPGAGNILAGKTALSLSDTGLTPGTLYFYKVLGTDSASNIGTSNVAGAYTTTLPDIAVGCISDSIEANIPHDSDNDLGLGDINLALYNPFKMACRYLELNGLRNVVASNQAVAGFASTNFAPAVTGLAPSAYTLVNGANSNVGSGQLLTALNGFLASVPIPVFVIVRLGANDCRMTFRTTKAQYQTNLQGICNALLGNGFVPVLSYPCWVQDGADSLCDQTSMSLIIQYFAACDAIIAGSNGAIKQGDTRMPFWQANNVNHNEGNSALTRPNQGLHPNQDGGYHIGQSDGRILSSLIDGVTASIVGGLFLFALKGLAPDSTIDLSAAAYHPLAMVSASDALLGTAGLSAPFSLGYFGNRGNQIVSVKDGIGGNLLSRLLPGQTRFLRAKSLTLGQNVPAVSGGGALEYALWR